MLEKLKNIIEKSLVLDAQLNASETYANPALYSSLIREQKKLQPLVSAYQRYESLQKDIEVAKELELSTSEIAEIRSELINCENDIRLLLLPHDANDDRNVIIEIRAGTGGEEAALFASDLYRMYCMYSAKHNWQVEVLNTNETELGGFKEIIFSILGEGAWSRLKYEAGSHCVKRIPETESSGRIQTSTATVAVLPELEDTDYALDMNDVRIDIFRSSGAGGQKVNKTSSAIRVTHIPTNTVVECQDERSQYQNKNRALQILRGRLWEAEQQKKMESVAISRREMVGTGERSEKIRTYFFLRGQVVEQRLVGDERYFPLEGILNGNLDEMIDRLILSEQAEMLKEVKNEY